MRPLTLVVGLSLAFGSGCTGDAPPQVDPHSDLVPTPSSAKEPAPPNPDDPFADLVPPPRQEAGPAPSTEAAEVRERVVLDLLAGKTRTDGLPEVATEPGQEIDMALRDRLAPRVRSGP